MNDKYSDEYYIGLICNGEFNSIPGITIGELFENFFDNINYNVINENDVYVDFTGEATCDDNPCQILIRFKISDDGNEFEIDKIVVDEDELSDEEILDLLDDIAYVCGATFEDDDYNYCESCTSEDCANCTKKYQADDEEEDQYDGYSFDDEENMDDYDDYDGDDGDDENDDGDNDNIE